MFLDIFFRRPEPEPEPIEPEPQRKQPEPVNEGPKVLVRSSFPVHPDDEQKALRALDEVKREFSRV